MYNCLELGNICVITCPSLQDPLWQESGSNCLVLREKSALTRPSLQDFGASCPAPFATAGYVQHIEDVGSCIVANNLCFALSNFAGRLGDCLGSLGHLSSFGVANFFSWHADNPSFHSIDDSLREDSDEKDACIGDLHIGSFGSWFPSYGNHKPICYGKN
jgi:hypothetical protein